MESLVSCSKLFQKRSFESYSEFYLAMCIAAECGRKGFKFDMSDMKIDKDILPDAQIKYFHYLISKGNIYIKGYSKANEEISEADVPLYMNMSYITDIEDVVVKAESDKYIWTSEWCNEKYTEHRDFFLNISNNAVMLMHLAAHMILSMYLGYREKKICVFVFNEYKAKSFYLYINLVSCSKTLDWFNEYIQLDIDLNEITIDLDYEIFCNNGIVAGRNKEWSMQEKKDLMKKYGMVEGSVVCLWERKGMRSSNPSGRISSSVIAIINEIGKDFVAVTTIPLNKTKEEVRLDFYNIPSEKRAIYSDLLNYSPHISDCILSLPSLGVENYFLDEYKFFTLLSKRHKVMKRITVQGKEADVEMNEVDAIYWLLCQYEIDFDLELYKHMYNNDEDLLWDLYGNEGE